MTKVFFSLRLLNSDGPPSFIRNGASHVGSRPRPHPRSRTGPSRGGCRATSPALSSSRWPKPSPRAIDTKSHLLVEAGTGVGKSFAYLVPAILAAAESAGRRWSSRPTQSASRSSSSRKISRSCGR